MANTAEDWAMNNMVDILRQLDAATKSMMELAANPSTTRKQRVDIFHDAADVQRIAQKYLLGTEAEEEGKAECVPLNSVSLLDNQVSRILDVAKAICEHNDPDREPAAELIDIAGELQALAAEIDFVTKFNEDLTNRLSEAGAITSISEEQTQ